MTNNMQMERQGIITTYVMAVLANAEPKITVGVSRIYQVFTEAFFLFTKVYLLKIS